MYEDLKPNYIMYALGGAAGIGFVGLITSYAIKYFTRKQDPVINPLEGKFLFEQEKERCEKEAQYKDLKKLIGTDDMKKAFGIKDDSDDSP